MVFSSILFVIIFLPVTLAVYYLCGALVKNEESRRRVHNSILLFFSLLFYAFGGPIYLLLMVSVILINWGGAFLCAPKDDSKSVMSRRFWLILIICLNVGNLLFFKIGDRYGDIILPIGISFYTFQALSYVIDVYHGNVSVRRNLRDFALYISFFPQLIAGPIVQYKDVSAMLDGRHESVDRFAVGIKRFSYGLAKKVIIANSMAELVDKIWKLDASHMGAAVAWLGAICYTLQIYYDFSGYSDMAIGLGKMFGFDFKENFNYPYRAESIKDFWRRWHMSLSTWFKDYVYIPLGGSRKGEARTYVNLIIVFFLTGLWHGANYTFLFWGLAYALILCIEKLFLGKLLQKNPIKILNRIYSFLIVMLLWVVFRSDNLSQAFSIIRQMFVGATGEYSALSYISIKPVVLIIVGILLAGNLQEWLKNTYSRVKEHVWFGYADMLLQMILLIASIILLLNGSYNPFIYYQF